MIVEHVEDEKKEIVKRYRKLLRHAKPFLKEGDSKTIRRAFNTAMGAHRRMRRKSGDPYIFHPLAVAQISVEEIGLGPTSIVAALLHDVVEDTDITVANIESEFGTKISKIIDGLTKIPGVTNHGSSKQAENFRKMLLTLSDDVRVILIKLADRLHNMRTLQSMPENKRLKIASETIYLYAPLAHRLGLYAIKSELEDLSLKYTNRNDYRLIGQQLHSTKATSNKLISSFIQPIKAELEKKDFKFIIKGRYKSIYSIWNKMKKQQIPFEQVYDLFAIRIIIDAPLEQEKAATWQVYSIVTDIFQSNPERLRDWISTPRTNGYESLHTTVMSSNGQWVEVQIRTKRMNNIAEKGYAAHWKYKEVLAGSKKNRQEAGLEQWIQRVRDLLEHQEISTPEFLDDFRSNLLAEEIFTFTPKGHLKVLPVGSTALDFAFDIHTEVGKHCIGAKVNQKLVSLNEVLNTGDQIEILTSEKQKPREDWLRFVNTSRARSKIKNALNEQRKEVSVLGKEIVQRKIKQMNLPWNDETINRLLAFFHARTITDIYYETAKGTISSKELKSFGEEKRLEKNKTPKISDAKSFAKKIQPPKGHEHDSLLIGEDGDIVDYSLAGCCSPISGDDVFGFVTVSEGIKIHRTSCPNAPELLANHGYRVTKAKWASKRKVEFQTGIRILGTDRVGLVNDITKIISNELKVNISSINIGTTNSIFEGIIGLFVQDILHLALLINKLETIEGVIKVARIEDTISQNEEKK